MERIEIAGRIVGYDRSATAAAYSAVGRGGPEECGCAPCLNWVIARDGAYPPDFCSLLDSLGIPFDREMEVYHLGRLASGLHQYGGWFHLIGTMEAGGSSQLTLRPFGVGGFLVDVHDRPALVREPFRTRPVTQIEFATEVPWLATLPEAT